MGSAAWDLHCGETGMARAQGEEGFWSRAERGETADRETERDLHLALSFYSVSHASEETSYGEQRSSRNKLQTHPQRPEHIVFPWHCLFLGCSTLLLGAGIPAHPWLPQAKYFDWTR